MTPERHLWNRGSGQRQNWYLKLPIPKPLRKHFPRTKGGNEQIAIIESLDTGDLAVARRKRDELIVAYRRIFDRLAAGETLTPEQMRASIDLSGQVFAVVNDPKWRDEMRRALASLAPGETMTQLRHFLATFGVPAGDVNDIADRMVAATRVGSTADAAASPQQGETISQAAEAWFAEMQRDPSAAVRQATLDGHRLRVRAFVEHCGDIPLASVTRALASDFLTGMAAGRSNRTVNNYAMTMQCLFKSARNRGRFQGENPFEDQRRKAGGEKREAFTAAELHKLFAALQPDIAPAKHSPESALPWAVRIAAYTGMRLEEIAQLTVADVQTRGSNGGTVVVFDVHNGDAAHHLKNDSSARAIPVHSELVRAGLLDYIRALPQDGLLFPGLKRRTSKGGKIGARISELFHKKLVALGMKRDGLCFHSLRNTVAQRLEAAAVSQTDAARVTGHAIGGMTYGVYSSGPGLKRLAAVVEAIEYDGLQVKVL
jgi:integrase